MKRNFSFRALSTVLGIAASATFAAQQTLAASATGTARQVVLAALSITNVSDLDFGTAAAGDVAKTVAPGTTEGTENGSFTVTGQANTAYTITLPADGAVTMITGAGGANETIAVTSFTSFPASGANGLLDGTGNQTLLVGATRAALGAAQVAGTYTGTYTVTVVY